MQRLSDDPRNDPNEYGDITRGNESITLTNLALGAIATAAIITLGPRVIHKVHNIVAPRPPMQAAVNKAALLDTYTRPELRFRITPKTVQPA